MPRTIDADAIRKTVASLDEGQPIEAVASAVGLSPYVVGLVAMECRCPRWRATPSPIGHEVHRGGARERAWVDAGTSRAIHRAVAAGWMSREEIAREFGVCVTTVGMLADSKSVRSPRVPKQQLSPGETVLTIPATCPHCGYVVSVSPCRICAARRRRLSRRLKAGVARC